MVLKKQKKLNQLTPKEDTTAYRLDVLGHVFIVSEGQQRLFPGKQHDFYTDK